MIRLGVLCPADIAIHRFMPALQKCINFEFVGIAVCTESERNEAPEHNLSQKEYMIRREGQIAKAKYVIREYGGKIFYSYLELIYAEEVDAVYIPLPPALHYRWAKRCLQNGKHVLLEKPFTTSIRETCNLLEIAKQNRLAIHENYMFVFHNQVETIKNIIESGRLGAVHLYDAKFGFPKREEGDFRYNKALGGGALLDCGGYLLKCAALFLGDDYQILYAFMGGEKEFDVDLYGSASLMSKNKDIMNIAYGMDYAYRCELRVWGSEAVLDTGRFFTAPLNFRPVVHILTSDGRGEKIEIDEDDSFQKSILYFEECITNQNEKEKAYKNIERQSMRLEEYVKTAKRI